MNHEHRSLLGTDDHHAQMGSGDVHVQSSGHDHHSQPENEDHNGQVMSDAGHHLVDDSAQVEGNRDESHEVSENEISSCRGESP